MTHSVYELNIENEIVFTPGPTAGWILAIDEIGDTYWTQNN